MKLWLLLSNSRKSGSTSESSIHSVKPLDAKKTSGCRVITVEDHYYEGGLGEAVCSAIVNEPGFTLQRLAVAHVPCRGKMSDLLKIYAIDRNSITQTVRKMLSSSANAK